MSDLRNQLSSAGEAYRQAAYDGDLGELAFAEHADKPRRRSRRMAAWGLALAASLLGVIALLPEESAPTLKPKLRLAEAVRVSPARTERPSLMSQMTRLSSGRSDSRPRLSLSAFRAPRLTTLKPNAAAITQAGSLPTTSKRSTSRRRELSTPSLTLRSLNDAISLGI